MNNTLIDNSSEELKMSTILKKCMANEGCNEIMIATGYWDLPGMVSVLKELEAFLSQRYDIIINFETKEN